jgi:hypothetical protein
MSEPTVKKLFPNPFYVLLLVASSLFVFTVFGYLVSPTVQQQGAAPGPGQAVARWLDRQGPLALGIEFAVMLVSALLAMATDRWYSPRKV